MSHTYSTMPIHVLQCGYEEIRTPGPGYSDPGEGGPMSPLIILLASLYLLSGWCHAWGAFFHWLGQPTRSKAPRSTP